MVYVYLIQLILVVLVGWGWVLNILQIMAMEVILTGLGVLKVVGIFIPPLGSLLGWFG